MCQRTHKYTSTKKYVFDRLVHILTSTLLIVTLSPHSTASAKIVNGAIYRVYGLDFSPYKDGQNPNYGSIVSEAQIRERLSVIAPYTVWIRTFDSTQGLEHVARIAKTEYGLKTAIGAWISGNDATDQQEMANLIAAAKAGYVDLAIVGSEVLLRGDLTEDELIALIEQFRAAVPNVPVTTGEEYNVLLAHLKRWPPAT